MKKCLAIFMTLTISVSGIAQNDVDALRYSQTSFVGTARFASMAGSMGALGADMSVLNVNPAGISIFQKTELTITPTFFSRNTSSNYNNTVLNDKKINFNLGNIGWVSTYRISDEKNSNWKSVSVGIAYNQLTNFNNRINIQGSNKTSSVLDTYVAYANGHRPADFDLFSTDLAWQTYLFNRNAGDSLHYHPVIKNYGELQKKSIESRGSMNETDLSFGADYKNKIYMGASLGIVHVKYREEAVYQEVDDKDTIPGFKSMTLSQNLTTGGTGVNFKLGVIVRATDWLRIGGAIHTPSAIYLTDSYSSTMNSDLDSGKTYNASSPDGSFDYSVVTPLRAVGSLGFIIDKRALINAEYEYVNYSTMQLHSSSYVFTDINNNIRSKYTSASNVRLGGEVRFDPIALRVGYALYGSPFDGGQNKNANRSSYTAGIGFRENNYFIDFGYVFTIYSVYDYLYDPALANLNAVKTNYKSSMFSLTIGFIF